MEGSCWDDVSGQALLPDLVNQARWEELQEFTKHKVYAKIDTKPNGDGEQNRCGCRSHVLFVMCQCLRNILIPPAKINAMPGNMKIDKVCRRLRSSCWISSV